MVHKLVIVGSGCAGATAAIYAARASLSPVVLEGSEPGGQLAMTTLVENFPGFPNGVQGPDLLTAMKQQAERFGAEFRRETAAAVNLGRRPFTVSTDGGESLQCEALIVASGASAQWLGLESESKLIGRGVSSCATCDGYFFRGQDVVVVGGGDTAMEDALFLTRFARKVTIVHRRDALRASKILAERAKTNPKIEFVWDAVVVDVLDPQAEKVVGVRLRNLKTGEETTRDAQGLFVAIGHRPNTRVFEGQLELKDGYIVVQEGSRTSVEGVFAAGDVHDRVYRQAVTAAGSGCRAAIDAARFLEEP
jgi:thioredoxin reductase (NADPH)